MFDRPAIVPPSNDTLLGRLLLDLCRECHLLAVNIRQLVFAGPWSSCIFFYALRQVVAVTQVLDVVRRTPSRNFTISLCFLVYFVQSLPRWFFPGNFDWGIISTDTIGVFLQLCWPQQGSLWWSSSIVFTLRPSHW